MDTAPKKMAQTVKPAAWDLNSAMAVGKSVYEKHCQACHQANGKGMPPMIPAMVGGAITTGEVKKHIMVLLEGIKGTAMQAFEWLSDEDIAGVVTYERNAWGNDDKAAYGELAGGLVTPEQVSAMRTGE